MFVFEKINDNSQFLSIQVLDGTDTSTVYDHLCEVFDGLSLFARDSNLMSLVVVAASPSVN